MNRTLLVMIGSVSLLVASLVLLAQPLRQSNAANQPLMMYCAASNRAVIEAIRVDYEREFGTTIQVQYGPSQTLLASLEVSGSGDLFLPADDSYLIVAKQKKLVTEVLPLAKMQTGVAVKRGNPKAIQSLTDLMRDDVRLVQANYESAAIGKITRDALLETEHWEPLDRATDAYRSSVTDVANDVLVGAADAGIVYDAVLHTYPELEFISVPELANATASVAVGITKCTKQPDAALKFAHYLAAADRGALRYQEFGFKVDK